MQGSEKSLVLKEKFMAEIARHPAFRNNDIHDLTKDEVRERTAEKFASMVYFFTSESIEAFQERMALISIADPGKLPPCHCRCETHADDHSFLGTLPEAIAPRAAI